jgi:hypothetical protein
MCIRRKKLWEIGLRIVVVIVLKQKKLEMRATIQTRAQGRGILFERRLAKVNTEKIPLLHVPQSCQIILLPQIHED